MLAQAKVDSQRVQRSPDLLQGGFLAQPDTGPQCHHVTEGVSMGRWAEYSGISTGRPSGPGFRQYASCRMVAPDNAAASLGA
jgi:hypothetical protein